MAYNDLHSSAAFNAVDHMRREIDEGIDINEPDHVGMTPLHRACFSKSYEAAKMLLEAGAEVNVQDNWGITPLARAVFSTDGGDHTRLVQLLVDYGADPTIENEDGNSALKLAKDLGITQDLAILRAATER